MIKLGAPPPEPTKTCVRKLVHRGFLAWLGHALDPRFESLERTDGSGSSLQQETQSSQTWLGWGWG